MQYADDTTIFVRDYESVTQLLKLLEEFKVNCGLEIPPKRKRYG